MHHIPFIIAGAAIKAYCKHRQNNPGGQRERPQRLRWAGTITSPSPIRVVRPELEAYLSHRGFGPATRQRKSVLYQRGDRGITRLPCNRDVRWPEVPIVVGLAFERRRGGTQVGVCIAGWPGTAFAASVAGFFEEHAEQEFEGAIEYLNRGIEPPGQEAPPPPRDPTHDDDLKLLGLARGCSWEQLQSAYRAACRKYHPDRLAGVPEDVVKLAQEHFVKIQAAYERLRERTAQPQACEPLPG